MQVGNTRAENLQLIKDEFKKQQDEKMKASLKPC